MEPTHHPYKSTTHEEKYYHFKELPFTKYKAITVFARKNDDMWYMYPAFCVHGDQFSRKIGRQVARRKFFLYKDVITVGPTIYYEKVKELTFILACKVI